MLGNKKEQIIYQYQYSWKFLPNNARSHRLLQGHMTSNKETVYRQNLWAGKIKKNIWHQSVKELPPGQVIKCLLFNYLIIFLCVWYQITCYFPGSFRIGTLFLELFLKKRQTNNKRRSLCILLNAESVNRLSCLHQSPELSSSFLTFSSVKQWLIWSNLRRDLSKNVLF